MERKKLYFPFLDGLRGLSISWVIIHHMPVSFPSWLAEVANRGDLGVEFFFAISGFVVIQSLLFSTSVKEFYFKRAFRILPAYWMTLISIFIISLFDERIRSKLMSIENIWSSFPLFYYNYVVDKTQGTIPGSLNVLWSLCFEEQFYFLIGILFLFFGKKLNKIFPLLILFIILIKNLACHLGWVNSLNELQFQTHLRLDAILIGCVGFFERERLGIVLRNVKPWFYWVIFFILAFFHSHLGLKAQGVIYSILPIIIMSILLSTMQLSLQPKSLFENKWMMLLGVCSYEIYLTHEIVLGGLVRFGVNQWPFLYLLTGFIVSSLVGILFHYWITDPLNKSLRKKFLSREVLA